MILQYIAVILCEYYINENIVCKLFDYTLYLIRSVAIPQKYLN